MQPRGRFIPIKVEYMENGDGEEIGVANRPQSIVRIKTDIPIAKGSMMRAPRSD